MKKPLILFLIICIFCTSFTFPGYKKSKTILAVFAHPDDEAVTNVSALLAKYAREGHRVYLIIATKGELGTNDFAGIPAGDSLARVRAMEAECAAKKLGIQPVILLGMNDGKLATTDFTGKKVREKIDSTLQLYQPDVIITWGPDGGYGHFDHRSVHTIVTEIVQSGVLPKTKLYYAAMPVDILEKALATKQLNNWMYNNWKPVDRKYATTRIFVARDDQQKAIDALHCHRSQFDKDNMEQNRLWMLSTRDTVFLRPFIAAQKISYSLFK
jgi:LmbE family N-acetylglucosaminyl deacetylase